MSSEDVSELRIQRESFSKSLKATNVYVIQEYKEIPIYNAIGSFVIKKRAKKIGRHIKKNVAIEIPEHYIPSFKPAKIFVEQVKTNVTSLPEEEKED